MTDAPRQPAPASPSPGPYRLQPIACRHRDESCRLILRAAESVSPQRAVVLGAGPCSEIPLPELVARFGRVTLNDIDEAPLSQAIEAASFDDTSRAKIDCCLADLTGATQPAIERIAHVLQHSKDSTTAIDGMAQVLDSQPLGDFPIAGKCDLIVASCVLSQLHFAVTHQASDRFEQRFAGQVEQLQRSTRWTTALDRFARRMEDKFIADLAALVAPGGIIYLSESVQMCYIQKTPSNEWHTEGTYRMLRSKELSDYLTAQLTVVDRARWEWIVMRPTAVGDIGRLYAVQALVLRRV